MVTHDDIRQICSQLPGSVEGNQRFGFEVPVKGKLKGYAWSWAERVDPKKARVINDSVLAIRTPGLTAKEVILASDQVKFFTEPHYNGYPAVLVRLSEVDKEEIENLLIEGWKSIAPKELLADFEG